jgi:hypothetical protein
VRSVTEISMMFMIRIPPISSERDAALANKNVKTYTESPFRGGWYFCQYRDATGCA